MIKTIKKFKYATVLICTTILVCMLALMSIGTTYAYSTNISGTGSTINPSKDQLNGAKDNPKYGGTSEKIYGNISSSQNTDIFHYEAPYQGYYALYADSNIDTVGKVYEHKNFLWWQTRFEDLQSNDDGSRITGNNRDFYMVQQFERKEDYFIAIRGYGSNTGSYYLNIEPNEDKRISKEGGIWKNDQLDNSSAQLGFWTSKRQYLSQAETLLFYYFLDPAVQDWYGENFSTEYIYTTYQADTAKAMDIIFTLFGLIPNLPFSVSVSSTIVGGLLSYAYENSNTDAYTMMKFLADDNQCDVRHNPSTGEWSVKKGLIMNEKFNKNMFPMTYYNHESYSTDVLTGQKYCKGSWTK